MAYNATNPTVVGQATRKSAYDRVFDNARAVKEATSRMPLGGNALAEVADTAYVTVPDPIIVELDGTNVGGLTVEVHAMVKVRAGTGRIRLWNITTGAIVGAEITFTNTTIALAKITGLSVATGVNQYRVEVRGAASSDLPTVYGAQLVLR